MFNSHSSTCKKHQNCQKIAIVAPEDVSSSSCCSKRCVFNFRLNVFSDMLLAGRADDRYWLVTETTRWAHKKRNSSVTAHAVEVSSLCNRIHPMDADCSRRCPLTFSTAMRSTVPVNALRRNNNQFSHNDHISQPCLYGIGVMWLFSTNPELCIFLNLTLLSTHFLLSFQCTHFSSNSCSLWTFPSLA